MHPRLRAIGATLAFLLACEGGGPPMPDPETRGTLSGSEVQLTRFRSDSFAYTFNSGITSPLQVVVRDAAAWEELWRNIHSTMTPAPALPEVDFTREMIIAAGLGNRSSGGYDILLARAAEDASALEIEVIETSPGAGCVTTQALTQPVDLARVARRDGPVRFVETRHVRHCVS